MARRFYSSLFWAFLTVSSILLFPVAVVVWAVTLPFDRRLRVLHGFTCFWASLYTWCNPAWPVTIEGREKLRSDRAAVMVANHLSLLDILVLFRIFTHFKWVSKIENFRIPCIGWNMSLNRYIKLKRGDRKSVVRMLEQCEVTLRAGSSIMMFPEGTRSATGVMKEFKPGAFELALRTGCPVQPILIQGTARALPKRGFVLQGRHPIRLTVLDPISAEAFQHLSAEELTRHVRNLMASALEEKESPPVARIEATAANPRRAESTSKQADSGVGLRAASLRRAESTSKEADSGVGLRAASLRRAESTNKQADSGVGLRAASSPRAESTSPEEKGR